MVMLCSIFCVVWLWICLVVFSWCRINLVRCCVFLMRWLFLVVGRGFVSVLLCWWCLVMLLLLFDCWESWKRMIWVIGWSVCYWCWIRVILMWYVVWFSRWLLIVGFWFRCVNCLVLLICWCVVGLGSFLLKLSFIGWCSCCCGRLGVVILMIVVSVCILLLWLFMLYNVLVWIVLCFIICLCCCCWYVSLVMFGWCRWCLLWMQWNWCGVERLDSLWCG